LSEYIDKTESVLTDFQASTGIPWDFQRFSVSSNDQLPDSYIVYFLVDDPGQGYSDNKETSHTARIQISFYYRDVSQVKTIPDAIEAAFTDAGFTRGPAGTIPYQSDTGHYGWRRDFYFYERR